MGQFETYGHRLRTGVLLLAVLAGNGCAFLVNAPDALTGSLMSQSDPILVESGTPSYLLLMDAMVRSSPNSSRLLLASSDANAAYAAAFLNGEDSGRARLMYAKARDYALRVLRKRRAFRRAEHGNIDEYEKAVACLGRRDVPALYSAGTAWLGWIVNSPDSVAATAQLSRALPLIRRVMALQPGYQHGGPEMLLGIYYAVQPRGAGRDMEKSKALFEKSIAFAGDDLLLPRVAYAEFWARYAFDRVTFERVLQDVLDREGDGAEEFRLMNAVAKKRAQRLLEEADDLF